MAPKQHDSSLSTLFLLATLIYNVGIVGCQIKRSETFPIFGATGPESLAFDRNGGGPYTGVSDGRIIKWQANVNRWVDFATTTPYRLLFMLPTTNISI